MQKKEFPQVYLFKPGILLTYAQSRSTSYFTIFNMHVMCIHIPLIAHIQRKYFEMFNLDSRLLKMLVIVRLE